MNNKACRFCGIAKGQYADPIIDRPLLENADYFVIPSLGAIVEGWMLVVPKNHYSSLRSHYCNDLFLDIVKKVSVKLHHQYGHLIMFEHGSNCDDSVTGCGVNHAHYHIVPMSTGIMDEMISSGYKWDCVSDSNIQKYVSDKEYLLYAEYGTYTNDKNYQYYIHLLDSGVSQYFRKIIAEKLSVGSLYDYKKYPFFENIIKGIGAFKKEPALINVY